MESDALRDIHTGMIRDETQYLARTGPVRIEGAVYQFNRLGACIGQQQDLFIGALKRD